MKKVVVGLNIYNKKDKKKALQAVTSVTGIDSVYVNLDDKVLTVIGDVDPIEVVRKLRKTWHAELISVGPDKEPKKKDDEKKEPKKKDDEKKNTNTIAKESEQAPREFIIFPNAYGYMRQPYFYSVEENPGACVICYTK